MDRLMCSVDRHNSLIELGVKIKNKLERFTAQELFEFLPSFVLYEEELYALQMCKSRNGFVCRYETSGKTVITEEEIKIESKYLFETFRVDRNMANAFASLLILILKQNVVRVELLNQGRIR